MSFEALRDEHGNFYSPRFAVTVGDLELTEADGVVSNLSVDLTRDGADRFSFGLTYPYDYERATFSGLDWDVFDTGTEVSISIGYEGEKEPMVVGTLESIQPDFPSGGSPTVSVSGYGKLHEMMRGTTSDSWTETSVSDVVDEVASQYFGDVTVDETGFEPPQVMQDREHDFKFLQTLADMYGFEIITNGDQFEFRARASTRAIDDPVVTLRYGETLDSFSPEINDADQVASVEVRHWDDKNQEAIVGSAESDGDGTGKEVVRTPVDSEKEANEHAKAELGRISESYVTGSTETIGIPEIVPGEAVDIEGLPERFNGTYYVTKATHRVGSSGYTTSFDVTEKQP